MYRDKHGLIKVSFVETKSARVGRREAKRMGESPGQSCEKGWLGGGGVVRSCLSNNPRLISPLHAKCLFQVLSLGTAVSPETQA